MRASMIWRHVAWIGSQPGLFKLAEVLLSLQVLLAESGLSVLTMPYSTVVIDCVHASVGRWAVRRVTRLLTHVILMARRQLAPILTRRRKHLLVIVLH